MGTMLTFEKVLTKTICQIKRYELENVGQFTSSEYNLAMKTRTMIYQRVVVC